MSDVASLLDELAAVKGARLEITHDEDEWTVRLLQRSDMTRSTRSELADALESVMKRALG